MTWLTLVATLLASFCVSLAAFFAFDRYGSTIRRFAGYAIGKLATLFLLLVLAAHVLAIGWVVVRHFEGRLNSPPCDNGRNTDESSGVDCFTG